MSSSDSNSSDDHDVDDHDVDDYDVDDYDVDDDESEDHNADHVIDEEDYDDESDDTVPTTEEALATTAATAADSVAAVPGGGNAVPPRPLFVGLRVDLRDPDQVWSAARVEEVFPEDDDGGARARLRYDGWGAVWDETLPWPCDRVAQLHAYTRRVRCGVSISGRARRAWPCRAQIRMPRPGDARAAALLAAEPCVFVQPYGADLLPRAAAGLVGGDDGIEGGCWVKVSRLRRWRCGGAGAGVHKSEKTPTEDATERAWVLGERDADCVGVLPPKPFAEGSLLRAAYRVAREIDLSNDDNERCYTGALDLVTATSTSGDDEDDDDEYEEADVVPDRVGSAAEDVDRTARDDDAAHDARQRRRQQRPKGDPLVYEPPPELSSTAVRVIEEPVHPDVVRLRKTKRWTARVRRNGAEILLGSFSTQSRALRARETTPSDDIYREGSVVSVSQDVADEVAKNVVAARREDARLVPLATLISVWENSNDDAAVAATTTAVVGGGSGNPRRGSVNSGGGSSSNSLNSNKKSSSCGGNNSLNGSKKNGGGKTKKDNFSAHDWVMQRIRHEEYLKELERRKRLLREETKDQNDDEDGGRARKRAMVAVVPTSSVLSAEPAAKTSRSSRKRYVPRKVDLVRHVYIS